LLLGRSSDVSETSLDQPNSGAPSVASGRTRRLIEGTLATMLSKGVVLAVNAISIPIVVRYLGAESFGVWVTISTALSMLLLLDLGVANSLTNFISEAYAAGDRDHASVYSTTALGIMVIFALFLGGIAWWIWPHLNWEHLFHLSSPTASSTVGRAVAVAVTIFLVGLPAGLAPKILGGYQELRLANLFATTGSICSLIAIIVLVRLHAGLVALVAAPSAAFVGANLLCLIWIWLFHKPWLSPRLSRITGSATRRMMQTGSEFFVLQLAGLVVFNSDNLVVTHYLGPAQVTSYSVAWRLVSYAAVAQTLISPALWPAFSEAFARGDMQWVRNTFRRTMLLTMGSVLAFCLIFAWGGRTIIRIWASSAAVPTEGLLLLMCVWILISTFMNNTATVLVAKGQTRLQAWCSLGAAAINLALSIYWVQRIGAIGVILGTIVSYLLVLVIPQTMLCYSILSERKRASNYPAANGAV